LVPGRGATDALIAGERIPLRARMWSAVVERLASKVVPGAVTFALASHFLSGTTAVISAAIGLGAAGVGVLIEAAIGARASSEWKWKELS